MLKDLHFPAKCNSGRGQNVSVPLIYIANSLEAFLYSKGNTVPFESIIK